MVAERQNETFRRFVPKVGFLISILRKAKRFPLLAWQAQAIGASTVKSPIIDEPLVATLLGP
jgi:hypothetical protein